MTNRLGGLTLAVALMMLTASCASDDPPGSASPSDGEAAGEAAGVAAATEPDEPTDEPQADPEEPSEPSSQLEPYVNAAAVEQPPPDGDTCAIANYVHTHLGAGLDIVRTAASMHREGEPIARGPIPYAARHLDRAEDGIVALDAPELAEVVEASAALSVDLDELDVAEMTEEDLGARVTELREAWRYGDAGRHPEPWVDWLGAAGC